MELISTILNEYLLAEAAAAHVDTVKLILADPCVNIHIHDPWGMSVLMQAIQGPIYSPIEKPSRERLELVEYLLPFDIELDRANHAGETALILASRLGSVEIVGALYAHGANPNMQDQTGRTALDWIAMRDKSHHELMRLLLNYGADPITPCAGGRTPENVAGEKRGLSVLTSAIPPLVKGVELRIQNRSIKIAHITFGDTE